MNVLGLLAPDQARRVRASLPKGFGSDWFVGIPLRGADAETLLARVDDAAAEAVAKTRIGNRAAKPRKR